jgi:hypothetical protein
LINRKLTPSYAGDASNIIGDVVIVNQYSILTTARHNRKMNKCGAVILIAFFFIGFKGSSWLRAQVENAGYHHHKLCGWSIAYQV